MKKFFSLLCVITLAFCMTISLSACKEQGEEEPFVNYYKGGSTFDFAKWQGKSGVYTITDEADVVQVSYNKISSADAYEYIMAEISGDLSEFYYVNITASGINGVGVSLRLGDTSISASLIGESKFLLEEEAVTYTYKVKNRLALCALETVYLSVSHGVSGLSAMGDMNIYRAWFSKEAPDGFGEGDSGKSYDFASGGSWVKQNGWFVDTSWTNINLLGASGGRTRIFTSGQAVASFAQVLMPIEPETTDTTYAISFENENNSVEKIAILLRGKENYWHEGGYYIYYESTAMFWENSIEGSETNTVTLEFDLEAAMAQIGDNVNLDGDGYVMVLFIESHEYHPSGATADGLYSLIINYAGIMTD